MMSWRRLRESLYNPHAYPVVFFVVAFCIGISINVISSLLIASLQQDKKVPTFLVAAAFGVPALIVLILTIPGALRRWTGNKEISAEIRRAHFHKGVIAIASLGKGIDIAEKAIKYHMPRLEKAWLICSEGEGPSSKPLALALKAQLENDLDLGPEVIEVRPLSLKEFEHPESVKNTIDAIYESMPEHFSEDDIIIDVTGGRKLTSAGAFLAGLPKDGTWRSSIQSRPLWVTVG